MKKVTQKNGKKETFFNEYVIGEANACPECKRIFKPYDLKFLNENGKLRCPKCNSKLKRQ